MNKKLYKVVIGTAVYIKEVYLVPAVSVSQASKIAEACFRKDYPDEKKTEVRSVEKIDGLFVG